MVEQIARGVWKINVDSNLYILEKEEMVIDTGPEAHKGKVLEELRKIINPNEVKTVILTHLHYDHIGNFDLFPNAKFYTSPEEIASFKEDPAGTVLDKRLVGKMDIELLPLTELEGFDLIKAPGHTKGIFCLFHKKSRVLFSSDVQFFNGIGRLDLPTSVPELMDESLEKLKNIPYEVLAPGHDY